MWVHHYVRKVAAGQVDSNGASRGLFATANSIQARFGCTKGCAVRRSFQYAAPFPLRAVTSTSMCLLSGASIEQRPGKTCHIFHCPRLSSSIMTFVFWRTIRAALHLGYPSVIAGACLMTDYVDMFPGITPPTTIWLIPYNLPLRLPKGNYSAYSPAHRSCAPSFSASSPLAAHSRKTAPLIRATSLSSRAERPASECAAIPPRAPNTSSESVPGAIVGVLPLRRLKSA